MEGEKKESTRNWVCLKILRYNPRVDKAPCYQDYFVPLTEEKMSLLQALEYVYTNLDDTVAFRRYCCGIQYCNSCVMFVDGRRTHACLHIVEPGTELHVAPISGRRVLRDLIVETADAEGNTKSNIEQQE
ncbi:2Fe-2S iron-sulfur cluster-binding protein [Thermodesulfobacteriota bacterium]